MMPILLLRKKDKPTLDVSFLGGMPPGLTFTRASAKWRFNASGNLEQLANNSAAFDYDPVSLTLKGLSLEEQRTNGVQNSTMQGAVVGTPGTLPTYWARGTDGSGLSHQVVGLGTEYGMPYIDLRLYGTTAGQQTTFYAHTPTNIAAVQNEVWSSSFYHRVISGSAAWITNVRARFSVYNSGGSYLQQYVSYNPAPTSVLKRDVVTATITDATAAWAKPAFELYGSTGVAVDMVWRIYQPQIEKGTGASSPIPTSGSVVTRAADNLDCTSIPWFNASSGTLAVEYNLRSVAATANPRVAMFNDGDENDRLGLYLWGAGNKLGGIVVNGGTVTANTPDTSPVTALVVDNITKQAMRYAVNDVAVSNNGSAVQTDNTVTLPSGIDRLTFGRKVDDGAHRVNGWLRRFRYWNYGLDNTTLQQVTQ